MIKYDSSIHEFTRSGDTEPFEIVAAWDADGWMLFTADPEILEALLVYFSESPGVVEGDRLEQLVLEAM